MKPRRKQVSLYGGDVILAFDPGEHRYSVSCYGGVFAEVPSVTQALRVIDKSGGLTQWAANQAVDHVRERVRPGVAYTPRELEKALADARIAYRSTNGKALAVGSVVHKWLEGYFRRTKILPLPKEPQANQACRAALEWLRGHDFQPKALEMLIYSRAHRYAGTTDALGGVAIVAGRRALIDWKSSKAIYPEMRLQLAAYAHAVEEMTGERVEDRWIVRLDKATGIPEAVRYTRDEQAEDLVAFLAALGLWKAMARFKPNGK